MQPVYGASRGSTLLPQLGPLEDPHYLQEQIITYIGNKRALLGPIERGIVEAKERLGRTKLRIADLFSGTGIVARAMKRHASHLLANDLEAYSRVTNSCY